MSGAFAFTTMIEILVAVFLIWGLFFEDKLVKFEDKLWHKVKYMIFRRSHSLKVYDGDIKIRELSVRDHRAS